MRRVKLCLLLGLLLQGPLARAGQFDFPDYRDDVTVTVETLPQLHRHGVVSVQMFVGKERAARMLSAIERLGPDLKVVAGCVGSFDQPGRKQMALGLVQADLSRMVYVAFVKDSEPQLLLDQAPTFVKAGVLPMTPTTYCESWTALERQNDWVRRNKQPVSVKRVSQLDSACVAPVNSDMEFLCYQFDSKKGKFVETGGWAQL